MGKRGPQPQPTNLKVLRGNPGRRPLNDSEPEFDSGDQIVPPAVLGEHGRAEFYRVTEQLLKNGLFTVVDVPSLTVYCQAWERFIEAEEFLSDNGLYYEQRDEKTDKTTFKEYPQVGISHKAAVLIDKIASKFGFTPADRTSIKAKRPDGTPQEESVFD